MMDQRKENLPHLFPTNTSTSEPYKSHNIKIKRSPLPARERIQHGNSLREQLKQIQPVAIGQTLKSQFDISKAFKLNSKPYAVLDT